MYNDIQRVLITKEELKERVETLGKTITEDYKDTRPLMLGVLNGSFVFFADLLRAIPMQVDTHFIKISSYGAKTQSTGEVSLKTPLDFDVLGKDVVIVEDIIDSGNSMNFLKSLIEKNGARTVKICALLDKPSRRVVDVKVDYVGFSIPDEFIVGYGLDYAQSYRNLPEICVLKPEIFSK